MVKDNELISIIVPVYNVEKYLKKCLDSIINQTYKNLEIILIDDGSTDKSKLICDEYQRLDNRVKVICKKNGGQSSARNMGLDIMTGEYVCFVDSDDFVHTQMVEKLYTALKENDADIISCQGMDYYDFEIKQNNKFPERKIEIYDSKEALLKSNDTLLIRVYQKLFSKKIFETLRFKENIIYEDAQIAPYIYIQADRTVIISDILYYRFVRENSTIHSKISDKDFAIIEVAEDRLNFYLKNKYEFLYNQGYTFLLGCYVILYKKAKNYGADISQIIRIKQDYKNCYKKYKKKITFMQRIKYGAFLFFPNTCINLLDRK